MSQNIAGRDALAHTPDPDLAAAACRTFLIAFLFNDAEHVEWEDLEQVLAIALRAFGLGELDDFDPNMLGSRPAGGTQDVGGADAAG